AGAAGKVGRIAARYSRQARIDAGRLRQRRLLRWSEPRPPPAGGRIVRDFVRQRAAGRRTVRGGAEAARPLQLQAGGAPRIRLGRGADYDRLREADGPPVMGSCTGGGGIARVPAFRGRPPATCDGESGQPRRIYHTVESVTSK